MRSMKTINFPRCPPTPKFPSNLIPSIPTKTLNPRRERNIPLFLTLCSPKPPTQNDGNPSFTSEIQSNSITPQQIRPNPTSKPSISSTPTTKGLIFDLGPCDSWDDTEIGSPVVKRFLSDDEERWFMWYYGTSKTNPRSGSIGLAVSSNGVHWQRGDKATAEGGSMMNCGEDWWAFDTMSIRPSEVMVMSSSKVRAASGVYWLYYTGYTSEEVELPRDFVLEFDLSKKVFKSLPGLAISQDGRNWARIEGDHHSGALFNVGSHGDWDSLFIASPHVVFHAAGDLRMYYHSFDLQEKRFSIGMARSRDGIKWVKLGKVMGGGLTKGCFEEMGVVNACVVRDKKVGNYVMAYEGVGENGKTSIGIAVSSDGLKDWRRVTEKPVLAPSMEVGGIVMGLGLHVWFKWREMMTNGGCIIEGLEWRTKQELVLQFLKGVILQVLGDG